MDILSLTSQNDERRDAAPAAAASAPPAAGAAATAGAQAPAPARHEPQQPQPQRPQPQRSQPQRPDPQAVQAIALRAENADLRQRLGSLRVRLLFFPRTAPPWHTRGRLSHAPPLLLRQAEGETQRAQITELQNALRLARTAAAQAVQAAQAAQSAQVSANAHAQQAVQAAQVAQAETQAAQSALAAQNAQLVHAREAARAAQESAAAAQAARAQRQQDAAPTVPSPTASTTTAVRPAGAEASNVGQAVPVRRARPAPVATQDNQTKKPKASPTPKVEAELPVAAKNDAAAPLSAAVESRSAAPALVAPGRGRARAGGGLVSAIAVEGSYLFAAGVDNSLWKRSLNSRGGPSSNGADGWEHIGAAESVVAMATLDRRIYALDASSSIWSLDLYGSSPTWELFDDPPPPTKQHGIELPERRVALTTTPDGHVWVATLSNKLYRARVTGAAAAAAAAAKSVPKQVRWEHMRESVGVVGLVVIPTGSRGASASSECLLLAACEDSKVWHWKPQPGRSSGSGLPLAIADGSSPKPSGDKAWCPCGSAPVKPDRGIACCSGRLYVAGPDGIHVGEVGLAMQEDEPATPAWASSLVALPPISLSIGGGAGAERYSPSREEARSQRGGNAKGSTEGQDVTGHAQKKAAAVPARGKQQPQQQDAKAPARNGKGAAAAQKFQLKASDGKEYFEVERIIDKRPAKGKKRKAAEPAGAMYEYKVKWLNFDKPSDNTWEPWDNVCNCRELLLQFETSFAARGGEGGGASGSRVQVGGKRPRGGGVQNTVVGSGFVGGKRPRSSCASEPRSGRAKNGAASGTSPATSPVVHTVQRPRAQRLVKTAALHPSVAAEYEQAEAASAIKPGVSHTQGCVAVCDSPASARVSNGLCGCRCHSQSAFSTAIPGSKPAAAKDSDSAGSTTAKEPVEELPPGWQKAQSRSTGHTYYLEITVGTAPVFLDCLNPFLRRA